jgi:hypothetical protein
MITWQKALLRDLDNVKRGKEENGEDASNVVAAMNIVESSDSKEEVSNFLGQQQLGHFANLVLFGNYDRIAEAENGGQEEAPAADS